jgi:hypothetical protein
MMTPQVIFFIVIQSGLTAVLSAAVIVIQEGHHQPSNNFKDKELIFIPFSQNSSLLSR